MSSTALDVRRTLDLTRAPDEQWNEEMVQLVASQVLKRASTKGEQYYCLVVADSLGLNPFIGEIYFIPSKSRDGAGPGITPYIGRNGLVKKATERNAYYEAETVHENDRFRMTRKRVGSVEVTHSYGSADRGEIVGAYAFLHFRNGDKPAFFYAKLEEYLPTFDQDWKMAASPWGNQRSAMIEKCAMIGAGRKRLDLGNVLMDGEVASVLAQDRVDPRHAVVAPAEFDFAQFTDNTELADRLRIAATGAGWTAAKLEMVLSGASQDELERVAGEMERERDLLAERERQDVQHASRGAGEGQATSEEPVDTAPEDGSEVVDADVVEEPTVEERERYESLQVRAADLEARMMAAADGSDEQAEYSAELDLVTSEMEALTNPDQLSLGGE